MLTPEKVAELREAGEKANKAPMSEALTGTMTATKEAMLFNKLLIKNSGDLLDTIEALSRVAKAAKAFITLGKSLGMVSPEFRAIDEALKEIGTE